MKILWITLESILPANTGGRIGVFKRIEQLSKTEDIYLFYPYDDESELSQVDELKKYCKKVYPYSRQDNKLHALLNLWKYPYTVGSRDISRMKRDIRKCITDEKIDVVNIDFPHMCVNVLGLDLGIPIVLNEHNIEWKVYRTIASSQKNILKKIAYYIDSYRLKKYEKKIFSRIPIAKVTFVSTKDIQFMTESGVISQNQAVLIPVGADLHEGNVVPHDGHNIIFVGKMSYGPNIEAAMWFSNDVFPQIKKRIKDAKFYIVGKDPTDAIKALQSDDVIVTGMVDDVKDYYAISDLVVLPLKNGGGVKVKLLEAISYKRPIVSTSVGVEGTYFEKGVIIQVSDDKDQYSRYCTELLEKNDRAELNVQKAFNIFVRNYMWTMIGNKYREMFRLLQTGQRED